MKKILVLLFCLVCFICKSQEVWHPSAVIQAPNKTPEQILQCANQWAATYFATLSPVINNNGEQIVIELNMPFTINNMTYSAGSGYITGTVNIQVKEGRCKITFNNFNHFSTNKSYTDWWTMGLILSDTPEQYQKGFKWKQKREVYKRILERLNPYAQETFDSAAEFIPKCTPIDEDDW